MSNQLAKTSDPCSAMPMCRGSERGNSPSLVKRITSESCHTIEDFSFCDDEFEGILGLIAQRYDISDDVISSGEQQPAPPCFPLQSLIPCTTSSNRVQSADWRAESSAPLRSQGQTGGHLLANLPPCKKTSEAYSRIIEESLPSIVTRKENGKMMSKRTNVALQSLLETGDACGSGVTSGTKQKKITADEKGEATTSTPLTKVITLPPLLDGGNCSVSQLSTKSTLGRNARQRGKTITNKNNSQAVDVASPPVTKSHHGDNEGDDNKTAVCKGRNAADEPESTEQCAMLPSLINEKDTARKRKRGRACRKIAPIIERTTTSNSQTENSKVAPPSTVKDKDTARKRKKRRTCRKIAPIMERTTTSKSGTTNSKVTSPSTSKGHHGASERNASKTTVCKDKNAADEPGSGRQIRTLPLLLDDESSTNSESEAAAKSKREAILEMIKSKRNIIRLRPSKNGTIIDNKTSGETTFLEKGLKTVRTFSVNRTRETQLPCKTHVEITRNQLKENPWLIHDRIKRERLENVQLFSSDLEPATTSDSKKSTSLPETPVSIHNLSSLSQNVSSLESLAYSDRTVTLKKHDVVSEEKGCSGSKQKPVKRKKLNLSWVSDSEDSAHKTDSLTTTAHPSTAGNVQKVYPMNVKTIEVCIKLHTESNPSTRIVHQCEAAEGGFTIRLPPIELNIHSANTPSKCWYCSHIRAATNIQAAKLF
ncbi:hypothetical protein EB796_009614 [Bugula neritina]|uniref:Uncharacterized protein n=1 Tax=Bugula neritina TaxID=10212 RepID=A0A7J7K2F6_BUGNE|nr:hypothetical protein EB796_009614 [Bugula neritina]